MQRYDISLVAGPLLALALAAGAAPVAGQTLALAAPPSAPAAVTRWDGSAVALGDGEVRPYVLLDERTGEPVEIGVALSEAALEGLPTQGTGHHGGHELPHTLLLDLPAAAAAPFRFVELNWNPSGHEPDGVYAGVPHFDFHFYTITKGEREAIVPDEPRFAERANHVPAADYVPPFNAPLGPPNAPPAAVAVPMMGVHWVDLRSAELQALLGRPEAYRPFTTTFIHGSWDGRIIFWEPMITRAHILEKKTTADAAVRDEIIPIPTPARYQAPGSYPGAYRITWDAQAREYRIALTRLTRQG